MYQSNEDDRHVDGLGWVRVSTQSQDGKTLRLRAHRMAATNPLQSTPIDLATVTDEQARQILAVAQQRAEESAALRPATAVVATPVLESAEDTLQPWDDIDTHGRQ